MTPEAEIVELVLRILPDLALTIIGWIRDGKPEKIAGLQGMIQARDAAHAEILAIRMKAEKTLRP